MELVKDQHRTIILKNYHPFKELGSFTTTFISRKHGWDRDFSMYIADRMASTSIRPSKQMNFIPFGNVGDPSGSLISRLHDMSRLSREEQNAQIFYLSILTEVFRLIDILDSQIGVKSSVLKSYSKEINDTLEKAQKNWDSKHHTPSICERIMKKWSPTKKRKRDDSW